MLWAPVKVVVIVFVWEFGKNLKGARNSFDFDYVSKIIEDFEMHD